jgi:hypothetical protein
VTRSPLRLAPVASEDLVRNHADEDDGAHQPACGFDTMSIARPTISPIGHRKIDCQRPGTACGIMVCMGADTTSRSPLTAEQEAWVRHSEWLWREAHAIVAACPGLDVGDVYHALRSLDLTPTERLQRGLTRVRHRPHPD